ncbi:MAG: nicotinate (nicotinamide) nucleotide adenylyltransferase [Oscillospiraceae bacterium]|nr:nicotinate (nicotinamide) nucleotide adenylyltransferase [Oscillospiraceae bacterium]
MKIGIYGGSFNPPHLGHLAAAKAAVDALRLDKLVFVPAGIPPHKDLAPGSPTSEQRLEMTRVAADQLLMPEVTEVWDAEIRREGKSYTADTLALAAQRWPGAELWLLMGTDMFLTLHRWHEPEKILALAGVCAFGRTEQDGEEVFAPQRDLLSRAYSAKLTTIAVPGLVDISSTRLRELLPQGGGREFLPQAVYGYVLREKLYGTNADLKHLSLEDLRCVSYSMVFAKRLAHIRGCEEEAARLAKRWGADEERMRRAAILHDCTKYLTLQEHLDICDQYGIGLCPLERATDKLLHAKSGAALARHIFGVDDGIYNAILYHTTARGGMSLEEKLLYIADYMEPCRNFPEVGELRRLAYTDLDAAVGMGASLSMQEMVQRNKELHHDTLAAYEFYGKGNQA